MALIKLLNTDLVNKIAAGEVVERPVSVVKELVENSIDAGSTTITVEIKDGGISLIKVSDNGIGIDKSEVKTAFLKHSTSKIQNLDDLESVMTLGFRGEALSSISSVAQVEIITKTKSAETGICMEINGGEIVTERETAATNGTVISVRNLFYNTPARRKFLKKPATESGYISDVLTKLALGNPHIAFKYINNGSELIRTKGDNDLKSAIYQIYGKETAASLLQLDYAKDGVHITGYICKPEMYRSNRSYEHMFINGRHIKSEIISEAAEQAFKTFLPIGKFPVFFLFLKIAPELIDVNVHPTKLEVRFWNDNKMFEAVNDAVKRTVSGHVLIPEVSWQKDDASRKESPDLFVAEVAEIPTVKATASKYADIINQIYDNLPSSIPQLNTSEPFKEIYTEQISITAKEENKEANDEPGKKQEFSSLFSNYKIVGQMFDTYWVIEQENNVYIMDQHAAHERCLYEQLTIKLKTDAQILSQTILNPVVLQVTPKEMTVIEENMELLEKCGFEADKFGEKEVAIRRVPYVLKDTVDVNFFLEIVDKLSKVETSISNIYEMKTDVIATIACKAAVKGNNKLSYNEAKELIDKVLKLENPFTCPHGRPTIIKMTKYEIEKRFKRVI